MPHPYHLALPLASALALAGCAGTIEPDRDPGGAAGGSRTGGPGAGGAGAGGAGGRAGAGGAGAQPAALCKTDTPHPRRALRLTNAEVLTTLRALVPIDDAVIPAGFAASTLAEKPDEGLSISRAFHESVDAMATHLATKVSAAPAANPLANLGCAVADFGRNEACTAAFLIAASTKLFRGMGNAQDIANLGALARGIAGRSGGKTALEYAVRAMALNPKSLYLLEGLDLPAGANPATPSLMSAGEMASFLSFRILGRPPTDGLIAALKTAVEGAPTLPGLHKVIDAHFTRADLQRAAADFFAALLNVADIGRLMRDAKKHPTANAAFMQRLQSETYDVVSRMMRTDGITFAQVLTTEQKSATAGDSGGAAAAYARFGRPGLFTLPGVLAAISNVDHTDIPRRGRFLLKTLFCGEVPSPPANLVTMLPPLPATASERQRFEKVEMEPNCAACHIRVNRLGFALETYDEMGVARAQDEHGNPILTASTHAVPGHPDFVFADARDLFNKAAEHPVVHHCLAVQIFRHFARRMERGSDGVEDACLIRDIAAAGRASSYRLVDMFKDAMARTLLARRTG
jgi:hypothetical protein